MSITKGVRLILGLLWLTVAKPWINWNDQTLFFGPMRDDKNLSYPSGDPRGLTVALVTQPAPPHKSEELYKLPDNQSTTRRRRSQRRPLAQKIDGDVCSEHSDADDEADDVSNLDIALVTIGLSYKSV